MIDIIEGDLLILKGSSKEYPIRSCDQWKDRRMNSIGFRRMAIETASTKRLPGVASGLSDGEPYIVLSNIRCTPLDPVSPEIQKSIALDSPMKLLQTFIADSEGFVRLVVEDIKSP